MKPIVLCFSGRIGSGKTSISRMIAADLNCPSAGFGDFVRRLAEERGLDTSDRGTLQDLGASLIQERGFDWLCSEVIAASNWTRDGPLVVDGIRHVEAFQSIVRLLPHHSVLLVHLALDRVEPGSEESAFRGVDSRTRAQWEAHSTEKQVLHSLPSAADLLVSAHLPLADVKEQILRFLRQR